MRLSSETGPVKPVSGTVTDAGTDATAYRLARQQFLTAVLGHAATERQARGFADIRLAADAARVSDGPVAGAGPG